MKITTGEIAEILEGTVDGDPDVWIHGPSPIEEGRPGTVSFLANPKYEQFLYSTNASAVLVHEDFSPVMKINPSLIRVKNVEASVSKLFGHFQSNLGIERGIDSLAYVDQNAKLGKNVSVGKFAIINDGVFLGDDSVIHPQVYVGKNVKIGKGVTLFPGVKVYHDCVIGDNCIIHSNAVIGCDGFGYTKNSEGKYEKVPHLGKVIIEENVEIGSNTVVDRGTIGNTIIKSGVKLDNLIQIAHNVELGHNTVMAAQSGIAGSTKVGNDCIIGGQSGMVGHIKVADGTQVQAQSGIGGSVKKVGTKLHGTPAIDYNNFLKSFAHFKNLPKLIKDFRAMEKELQALKKKLDK